MRTVVTKPEPLVRQPRRQDAGALASSSSMTLILRSTRAQMPGCVGWSRPISLAENINQLISCEEPISAVHLISGGEELVPTAETAFIVTRDPRSDVASAVVTAHSP